MGNDNPRNTAGQIKKLAAIASCSEPWQTKKVDPTDKCGFQVINFCCFSCQLVPVIQGQNEVKISEAREMAQQ